MEMDHGLVYICLGLMISLVQISGKAKAILHFCFSRTVRNVKLRMVNNQRLSWKTTSLKVVVLSLN